MYGKQEGNELWRKTMIEITLASHSTKKIYTFDIYKEYLVHMYGKYTCMGKKKEINYTSYTCMRNVHVWERRRKNYVVKP